MQRAEDYGLLGARRSGPSKTEQRAADDAMLARTLDGIAKRKAERQAREARRATRKAVPPLGRWERRGGANSWDW